MYYANLIDQRRTDRHPWLRPKCAPWKYFAAQDYARIHACKQGMNYINILPAKSSDLAPIATSSYLQTWNGIFMDVNSCLMTESRGQLKCDSMERNLTLGWWHLNTVGPSTPHYIASEKEVDLTRKNLLTRRRRNNVERQMTFTIKGKVFPIYRIDWGTNKSSINKFSSLDSLIIVISAYKFVNGT